ncbi:MAG: phosphoglucosamine mutase [Bacteroidota bacterium]
MSLIRSISGIRGTIGGMPGEGLTPVDTVLYTSAYATWVRNNSGKENPRVVVGRDARISGEMVEQLVTGTLMAMGINVSLAGLATTPAVELAVTWLNADGGIILTASHNPLQWNALKLLNEKGEFLSASDGEEIIRLAEAGRFRYADVLKTGKTVQVEGLTAYHIRKILELPLVDTEAIRKARFRIAIDAVNSVGGLAIPALLEALGVETVIPLYCDPTGIFPHNPEPLPEHLKEIADLVVKEKADAGFVVDPDVDRLAIISEDGSFFNEEYTLVAVADYVLARTPGNTVSNLSSSRALSDVTRQYGKEYFASAVGEVNVTARMKAVGAVIGGEGNGGVIYPDLHYGRDALVGIALFLSHLAKSGKSCSELRKTYPSYVISKNKIELTATDDIAALIARVKEFYKDYPVNEEDGLKVDLPEGWFHLRRSNTEPIIRIYAEGKDFAAAEAIAAEIKKRLKN